MSFGALLLRVAASRGLDGDAYWHLAAGQWMVDHHRLLKHDIYSYTAAGRAWTDIEWGFDWAFATGWNLLGRPWALVVSIGPVLATLALVTLRTRRNNEGRAWPAAALVSLAMVPFIAARPQMLSYALFAACLSILAAARHRPTWYWVLAPLGLVWANVHGSFLLGVGVIAAEAAWASVAARLGLPAEGAASRAWFGLGAYLAATLVNPFGWRLWQHALGEATNSQLARVIQEWSPPDLRAALMTIVVVAPGAVAGWILWQRARPPVLELALGTGLWLAGLHSVRFLPYCAVCWAVVLVTTPTLVKSPRRAGLGHRAGLALSAVVMGTAAAGAWGAPGRPMPGTPVAAVNWLASHRGRTFARYEWGGYLIDRGVATFVDGRTDLYFGTPVLDRYLTVSSLRADPDPLLASAGVHYVLWTPGTPLAVYLGSDPHWATAYRDSRAVVFTRVGPPA